MSIQQQARSHVEAQAASTLRWGLGHALPRLAIRGSSRRGDLHGRLIESRDDATTFELFDRIRAQGPMHRSKFAWATASQPVVKEVLTSPDMRTGIDFGPGGALATVARWAFSSAPLGPLTPPSLLVTEPPDHTRYRKLVTRVFSVKAVQGLRERTQQVADELLHRLDPSRPVDLVETYCAQLPVTVIAEILGVPPEERHRVLQFGTGAAPSLDLGLPWGTFRQVESSLSAFDRWLEQHIESVRREPGDDLLSQLVVAHDDGGVLSDAELKSTAGLVLAAGFETTVNLLGNGIRLLHDHPEQRALLQERPELWPNAVDEALRLDPPVLLTGRAAARDTEIAGLQVRRGEMVTTLLAGANRDPEVFADPDRFDVTRENAGDHVSFSSGRHYCLGAALARMEGEVGLRTILDRFPDLRLEPGATRRPTRILRGFATLPATLEP
jgi:cytochrome P450